MCPVRALLISVLSGLILFGTIFSFRVHRNGSESPRGTDLRIYMSTVSSFMMYPYRLLSIKTAFAVFIIVSLHLYLLGMVSSIWPAISAFVNR